MWIPELLLRMQGRECKTTSAVPQNAKLFNATNVAWKELTKLYDSYIKPELIAANATIDMKERCNDNIDTEVNYKKKN